MKPEEHIGKTYGIYKILDSIKRDSSHHPIYKIECTRCGLVREAIDNTFMCPSSIVNTCRHRFCDGIWASPVKWENSRIGNIFNGLKERCYSEKDKSYRWYGAKNVHICKEWLKNPKLFEDWALENGYQDNLTIDRIDENKDYSPENCRWVTNENNAKYKSTTRILAVDGVSHTGRDWAKECQLDTNTINLYVRTYGEENTINFIRERLKDPNRIRKGKQTWWDVYMN